MSRGDNVQGILGAIGPFRAKWGLGRVPRSASFFCVVIHATFWQLHNVRFLPYLVTKRISVSRRGIRDNIFENFHFRGHFPPKSEFERRLNRHLTQSRLQVKGCTAERYCVQGWIPNQNLTGTPSPPLPFPSFPFPPLPLEVGPLNPARGSGGAL